MLFARSCRRKARLPVAAHTHAPPLIITPAPPPSLTRAHNCKHKHKQTTPLLPLLSSNLHVLQLGDNLLSGPLPPTLSRFQNLVTLVLRSNKFTGARAVFVLFCFFWPPA